MGQAGDAGVGEVVKNAQPSSTREVFSQRTVVVEAL